MAERTPRVPPSYPPARAVRSGERMKFGVVGLGRMGVNLSRAAIAKGHQVVGYDPHPEPSMEEDGLVLANSLASLVSQLARPRIVLLYVPHGAATDSACDELRAPLDP